MSKKISSKFHTVKAVNVNKVSTFLLTVNTNKASSSVEMAERLKEQLEDHLQHIFDNIEDYMIAFEKEEVGMGEGRGEGERGGGGVVHHELSIDIGKAIKSGSIETGIEIGGTMHRLHSHSLIRFEHSPDINFKMNLTKLRQSLPQGTKVQVRWIKDTQLDLLKYIKKSF